MGYRQCRLVRENAEYTAWIPEQYAKAGKYLQVHLGGIISNGWRVDRVFGSVEEAPDWRKAIRVHRARTGDNRCGLKLK